MLACVCQPTETALLFKGGPPIAMGPLRTNFKKHQNECKASMQIISNSIPRSTTIATSMSSSPSSGKPTGSLLNLRKIERQAKSTKILVNPVCSDSLESSDDSNKSKKANKWSGMKKRRLKSDFKNCYKPVKTEEEYFTNQNEVTEATRGEIQEEKSISCFKLKHSDYKSRSSEDQKSGKDNCKNENSCNWKHIDGVTPDVINYSISNLNQIVIQPKDRDGKGISIKDQSSTGKTDSDKLSVKNEVSLFLSDLNNYF